MELQPVQGPLALVTDVAWYVSSVSRTRCQVSQLCLIVTEKLSRLNKLIVLHALPSPLHVCKIDNSLPKESASPKVGRGTCDLLNGGLLMTDSHSAYIYRIHNDVLV